MGKKKDMQFSFFLRKDDLKPYLRACRVGPKNRSPSSPDSTLDFKKILKSPKIDEFF